jgi:uncharacterized protein (DUF3820 family)
MAIMPFGKYRGLSMSDIAEVDPRYLRWFVREGERSYLTRAAKIALVAIEPPPVRRRKRPTRSRR